MGVYSIMDSGQVVEKKELLWELNNLKDRNRALKHRVEELSEWNRGLRIENESLLNQNEVLRKCLKAII